MKRYLAFLFLSLFLIEQLTACAPKKDSFTESSSVSESESESETAEPIQTEWILNDDSMPYTIVRSQYADDDTVALAVSLREQLNTLAENRSAIGIADDWSKNDADADNDRYEILLGLTTRLESIEAANALPRYHDFSISTSGNKICITANTFPRLASAVEAFLKGITYESGKLIYRGEPYLNRYSYPIPEISILGTSLSEYRILLSETASEAEETVAADLQTFVLEQAGYLLEITTDTSPEQECEILIGNVARKEANVVGLKGSVIRTLGKKLVLIAESSAYYYASKNELFGLITEQKGKIQEELNISMADSALDFFLKDHYAAGLIKEEANLGVLAMLSCCEYYNDRMVYGSENLGEKWVYSVNGSDAAQTGYFDDMLTAKKKGANCASPINWAFTDMGIMPKNDRFYGGSTGGFTSYSGNARKTLEPYCEVFDYSSSPITFKELYKAGKVKAGDIFLCKHHTFIYRGDGTFYAAGHDGAWHRDESAPTNDPKKAVFDNWVLDFHELAESGKYSSSSYNMNYNYKVYYVVRIKDDYVPKYYRNRDGKVVENPMLQGE